MTSKEPRARQLIFADSNVFIEALYLPDSAAAAVIQLAATSAIDLMTCDPVIRDVENAILAKLTKVPTQLDIVLKKWAVIVKESRLVVVPAATQEAVRETYKLYIASMRHANDIPILAIDIDRYLHVRRKKRNTKLLAVQFLLVTVLILVAATIYSGCLWGCIRDPVPFLTLKTRIFPADAKALVHRGEMFQRRANLNEALADYEQAVLVDPNCADARDKKVNALLSLSLFDQAWDANQQLDHKCVPYLANKARIQQARGDYLAAAKSFEEARASDPLSPFDGNRLILTEQLYQAAGDFENASRCARSELGRLKPDSGAKVAWSAELAISLIGEGKYSEALHITNQIIHPRQDMYSPDYRLIRGRAYFGLGQYEAAIRDVTNYLGLCTDDEQAYKLRAACYRRLGDTKKADEDRLLYLKYQKENADVDF